MDAVYKDKGFLMNITTGTVGGLAAGAGIGLFSAFYRFAPSRTAPLFNYSLVRSSMRSQMLFFGALGFAFTAGENFARSFLGYQPSNVTLGFGSVGIAAVTALKTRSPFFGFQVGGLACLGLCAMNASDWKMKHLSKDRLATMHSNNPAYKA